MFPHLWAKMLLANQIAGIFKIYYLVKEVNDEIYYWHTGKEKCFLQVNLTILDVRSQACPKCSK